MSDLKAINAKLEKSSYVASYEPSTEDAKLYKDMLGDSAAVAQWAARMASYFAAERDEIANPSAKHADPEKKE